MPDEARSRDDPALLSVVVPMLDEEETVETFHERLTGALSGREFELICVDDGSTDRTPALLERLAAEDPRVRVVTLARNFGHQAAFCAGLEHARGEAVVTMDADLQDPPEVIPALVEAWRAGGDVVIAKRHERPGESRLRLAAIRSFYSVMSKVAQVPMEPNVGDFRLLDRRALEVLLSMPERTRFLRGMTSWIGLRQVVVPYDREARYAGKTKYPFRKLMHLAVDGITSFSHLPLQIAGALGLAFATVAFLGIPLAILARLLEIYVPGIASVLIVVLLLGGLQLLTLGIIGEYVARIYDEVKRRPLYVVGKRSNISAPDSREGREHATVD